MHSWRCKRRSMDSTLPARAARGLDAEAQGEFPVPVQGEHDLEPTSNPGVWPVPITIR